MGFTSSSALFLLLFCSERSHLFAPSRRNGWHDACVDCHLKLAAPVGLLPLPLVLSLNHSLRRQRCSLASHHLMPLICRALPFPCPLRGKQGATPTPHQNPILFGSHLQLVYHRCPHAPSRAVRGTQRGGFGMTPWCDDLVCSWRRLLADRHSLPFPWTLSLHRRWCPSASHHPLTFLFLLALTFPLHSPFPSLGLSLRRPRCPSASPHSFPSLSLGRLCQRTVHNVVGG